MVSLQSLEVLAPLAGGALIGLSSSLVLLAFGRVAGISGIFGGLLQAQPSDTTFRGWFLAGLLAAGLVARVGWPQSIPLTSESSLDRFQAVLIEERPSFTTEMARTADKFAQSLARPEQFGPQAKRDRIFGGSHQGEVGLGLTALAGVLVGYGSRLGNGCTSGHGVCGLSRLSPRSLFATLTFMTTGALAVMAVRLLSGGGS